MWLIRLHTPQLVLVSKLFRLAAVYQALQPFSKQLHALEHTQKLIFIRLSIQDLASIAWSLQLLAKKI